MSIVVTGATGKLGGLVVDALLARGVAAGDIVAAGRNRERLEALAAKGVETRAIDFDDPASLEQAFAGADRVLLVSGSEVGKRVAQHTNAIQAAKAAGVDLLVYTSLPRATTSSLQLAAEHRGTEEALAASGVPATVLRNCWYLENYTDAAAGHLAAGEIVGSSGDGKVSPALRAELAEAAAVVLTTDGHAGQVYELGGDDAFSLPDFAAELSRRSGGTVGYRNLSEAEHAELLAANGLPPAVASMLADNDRGVAAGELLVDSGDLSRILGRPTTSLSAALDATLA
jgi:NAD(P)H dehydrogenase (quinone)